MNPSSDYHRKLLIIFFSIIVIVLSITVSYNTHRSRKLINILYSEKSIYGSAESEKVRLLRELSIATRQDKIEFLASQKLKMFTPNTIDIKMISF